MLSCTTAMVWSLHCILQKNILEESEVLFCMFHVSRGFIKTWVALSNLRHVGGWHLVSLVSPVSVSSHGAFVQTVKSSMPVSDSWMRTLVTSVALNELLAEVSLTKKIEIVTLSSFFSLVFPRCEMNKFFPHLHASF